ncbi:MAG: hypothetical protein HY682_01205 [Chloroflexi bacterium]|nr:hypothetical protein [Chloroflexota bacterium]
MASKGMVLIDDPGALYLVGPDEVVLQNTYDRVLEVYRAAFEWSPPHGAPRFVSMMTPMRTYIKTWIYEWDLVRLGVTERPSIETETLRQSYEVDATLEQVENDSEETRSDVGSVDGR